MKKILRLKAGYLALLFITIMFMLGNVSSASQNATSWLDEPVTIRFQNETLNSVLEKIAKQTGIAILYDQELANDKVTGNYKDVKASEAITRLFSTKNKSIQVSQDKKVIVVKTFGAKNFVWAGAINKVPSEGQGSSPMTLSELEILHAQQYKEYKERISKLSEVIEGGITLGELQAMQELQYKEFQERTNSDNIVFENGMTRSEIEAMHIKQYEEFQTALKDDTKVLNSGMTRSEIKVMQKKQYEEHLANLKGENKVLGGKMTLSELSKLHDKQMNQFKASQQNKM